MIVARLQWACGAHVRDIAIMATLEPDVLQLPFKRESDDGLSETEVEVTFVREHETVSITDGEGRPIIIMRALITQVEAFGAIFD
jgi:hypothetical protein